jgi:hypothetical protein
MIMIVYAREPQGINTQVRFDFKKKIDSLFEDSVPVAFFPPPWPWITEHHGIGVWAGGVGGRGAQAPPKCLQSGRNPCVIREKHKNFGKIMLCPEKFLYVCEKYGILGKMFWYVRKHFGLFAKITVYYENIFDMSGENFLVTSQKFWGEILISDGRAN